MKPLFVSEVLTDRKSKFQGRCCAIHSQEEIKGVLQNLIRDDKHVEKASHPYMYAWRTGEVTQSDTQVQKNMKHSGKKHKKVDNNPSGIKGIQQGCFDCGESGAGQRLLTLLERANVFNVLIIVTRWYGGTALGSARFRHISSTAVQSLKRGGFLP